MFIQYLQTRCVLPVDLLMDQIILICAAIIDFPGAKHFKYTSLVWNSNQINRAFFCFVFIIFFFRFFFFGSSIAMGGCPLGWHLWTCCTSLYRLHWKMPGSLHRLKDVFIFDWSYFKHIVTVFLGLIDVMWALGYMAWLSIKYR